MTGTAPPAVGQPKRAARRGDGSPPSPRPRLLDHADDALQWLGTHQQPAVDKKGRRAGHPDSDAFLHVLLHCGAVTRAGDPTPSPPAACGSTRTTTRGTGALASGLVERRMTANRFTPGSRPCLNRT